MGKNGFRKKCGLASPPRSNGSAVTILVDARPLTDPVAGGVTRVAEGLLPALVATMPEHRFVFATTGASRRALNDQRISITRHLFLPNKCVSLLTWLGVTSFDRLIMRERPDALLLPNIGFIGRPNVPYALIVHDLSFVIEPLWYARKARWWHKAVHASRLICEATLLIAVSERTKQDVIERLGVAPEKIVVIPLGLDVHVAQTKSQPSSWIIPRMKRSVLALGGSHPRKNIRCIIETIRALRKEPGYHDLGLVLTGTHRDKTYPSFVTALQRPSNNALASLMQEAAAFLYPSWYEGYGLPLHEAARFGTPCIASASSCFPETAPTGTLLCSPAKPHEWVTALRMVLAAPDRFCTRTTLGNWETAAAVVAQALKTKMGAGIAPS